MNENIKFHLKPIKGQKLFKNIFMKSKKISNQNATIYISFTSQLHSGNEILYAAIVKKRYIKKAVSRNRAKRLIRASLREIFIKNDNFADLAPYINYLIVFWNKPFEKPQNLKLIEVKSNIEMLLESSRSKLQHFK